MAQVIREAKIVIHLEQGRVELKAPDLSAYLKQLDAQLQQTKQIERETTAAAAAQEHLNKATSGFRIITEKPTLQPHIAAQLPPELGGTLGVEGIRQTTQATQERAQSEAALARELKARAAAEREAANSPFGRGLANLKTESFDRGLLVMQQQRQQAEAAAQAAAARLPQLGPGNAAGARIAAQIKEQAAEQRRLNDAIAEGARLEAEQGAEAVQRHQQASEAVQAQQEAHQQAAKAATRHYRQAAEGANQAAEGAFRIGRAVVLLGVGSDESFQKMIRGLAQVQAYFDLFRGSTQIILGLQKATQSLAAAQQAQAIAAGTAAAAETGATVATLSLATATRTLIVSLGPLTIALGAIAAVLVVVDLAWKNEKENQREAAEQARENARLAEEAGKAYQQFIANRISRERELKDILFERMTAEQQAAELQQRINAAGEAEKRSQRIVEEDLFSGGGQAEAIALERQTAMQAIEAVKKQEDAQRAVVDKQQQAIDQKIRAIELQQRLVEETQREFDIQKQKVDAQNAQLGSLTAGQFGRIERIAEKIRQGGELTRSERDFLTQRGGAQGRFLAEEQEREIARREGRDKVFRGLPGGPELAAAEAARQAAIAARDKETGGKSASDAIAALEADKDAAIKAHEKFYTDNTRVLGKLAGIVAAIDGRLNKVEGAALQRR